QSTRQDHVARAVRSLLNDADALVRHRAMAAVATLKDREAIPALLAAAEAPDSRFEAANALAAVPDIRALHVYLRGLADRNTDLRQASAVAIAGIRDKAAPVLDQLARRNELAPALLPELRTIFSGLIPITAWRVVGPFPIAADPGIAPGKPVDPSASYEGAG